MSHVPDRIIQELKSIQNRFLWNSSTPKIKHSILIEDYAEEGLTLFSMGYFKNTTVWGGALWPPLVTSLFLKVEG